MCLISHNGKVFLGKLVSGETVEVDPKSISMDKDWPEPTCTQEVQRFLGFVNYHRDHIPQLAELVSPLYALTGKAPFLWTKEHSKSFQVLEKALLSAEVLATPQKEGVFILDTDASDVVVRGQLSQIQGDTVKPIAFASKWLTPCQQKYCATCKELLALITFTCQFRHYLLGFQNLSGFLLRWLWLTYGSSAGPQNKLGHPAGCRFLCWVPAEYKRLQKHVVWWLVKWITWR